MWSSESGSERVKGKIHEEFQDVWEKREYKGWFGGKDQDLERWKYWWKLEKILYEHVSKSE